MNIVGASGSAIFVTGSSVAKFEIQFPDWRPNDQKNYYQYALASKLQTSYYPPRYTKSSNNTGSAVLGINGFVNAPNGYIYGMPAINSTSVVKISTTGSSSAYTFITTASFIAGNIGGAALAPNNCIYMFVRGFRDSTNGRIYKLNTVTDQISVLGSPPGTFFESAFLGAILAPNGRIYALPIGYGAVVKLNPNDDTFSTFGSIPSNAFANGVLAPNGVIYCAPFESGLIYKIDTNTDTISTINTGLPTVANANRWTGGVLAPNNECIYFMPNSSTGSLKIDPRTDQITFINSPGSSNFLSNGGVVGPDGIIYGTSSTIARIIINPFNDTITSTTSVASSKTILSFDGSFYGIASSTLNVTKDNRIYDIDPNYVLSRYRNYF